MEEQNMPALRPQAITLIQECSQCFERKPNCTWDEGDMIWCLDCIRAWENENGQHWEDGSPLTTKKSKP
jgi:uncharacterized Zn ribbon protein